MAENKNGEPIVKPLPCLDRKPEPNRARTASHQHDSEVWRLCELLTRDIKEKERMKQK
jgi:hypothetical protein